MPDVGRATRALYVCVCAVGTSSTGQESTADLASATTSAIDTLVTAGEIREFGVLRRIGPRPGTRTLLRTPHRRFFTMTTM